jgi:hypothetical protein
LGFKLKHHRQGAQTENHDARSFAEIHCADAKSRCELVLDGAREAPVDTVGHNVASAVQKLKSLYRIEMKTPQGSLLKRAPRLADLLRNFCCSFELPRCSKQKRWRCNAQQTETLGVRSFAKDNFANRVRKIEETERRSLFRNLKFFLRRATVLAGSVALSGRGHFDLEIFNATNFP